MDNPTRPLNSGEAPRPADPATRRLDARDRDADSPACPKCQAEMVPAQLTGANLRIGSRQALPGPYVMNCTALVCVDCGYTELYALRGRGRGRF